MSGLSASFEPDFILIGAVHGDNVVIYASRQLSEASIESDWTQINEDLYWPDYVSFTEDELRRVYFKATAEKKPLSETGPELFVYTIGKDYMGAFQRLVEFWHDQDESKKK